MRILKSILLWLLSLGALWATGLLAFTTFVALSVDDARYARMEFLLVAGVIALGALTALVFAVAVNPWASQRIAALRGTRARWTTAIASCLAGTATMAGFFFVYNFAYTASTIPERRCAKNDPRGCLYVAEGREFDAATPEVQADTARLFRIACDGGLSQACVRLAELHAAGKGVAMDITEAARLIDVACGLGANDACVALGVAYRDGLRVETNRTEARRLFQRACDNYEMEACSELGNLFTQDAGQAGDDEQGVELYQRGMRLQQQACDGGYMKGCASLGTLFLIGQDYEQAADYFRRACDSDSEPASCFALGGLYLNGAGMPQDSAEAARLFQNACDGLYMTACLQLGNLYSTGNGVAQDQTEALRLFGRACEGDVAEACTELAFRHRDGEGFEKNETEASRLFAKACEGEDFAACGMLATRYDRGEGVAEDRTEAVRLYKRACDGGILESCYLAGVSYLNGAGVPKDVNLGTELVRKSCKAGDPFPFGALAVGVECP